MFIQQLKGKTINVISLIFYPDKVPSSLLYPFQGSIPASIGKLAHLVHLNLEDNALTGSLPSEIETLENLAFLDLSGQSLKGHLPTFKTNRDLRRLDRELISCLLASCLFRSSSNVFEVKHTSLKEFFHWHNTRGVLKWPYSGGDA